jgi:hypothetical protein
MQRAKPFWKHMSSDAAQQMTMQERISHLFGIQQSLWRMHEAMLDWQARTIEPEVLGLPAGRIRAESGSLRPEDPAG